MSERYNENAENQQRSSGTRYEEIKSQLQQGEYNNALNTAQNLNLTTEEWEKLSGNLDNSTLNEEPSQPPLNPSEYQEARTTEFGQKVDQFGINQNPGMKFVSESREVLEASNQIIEEILKAIAEAKKMLNKSKTSQKWTNFFPLIGSVYGLLKSKKIKNQLKKIEGLYGQLSDPKTKFNEKLKADNISPGKGQGMMLTSEGYVVSRISSAPRGKIKRV